jgi:hypothetical protein
MGKEFPWGGEGMNSIIAQDGMDIVVREAIAEACDRSRKRNQGDSQPWSEAKPLRLASFGWHRGVRFHRWAVVYDLEFQLVGGTGQAGKRTARMLLCEGACCHELQTGIKRKPSASCGAAKVPWAAPPGAMQQ